MTSTPLVTIVVPVYNGARFLAETLSSLLAQTHRQLRLICVDDASSDGSADIARATGGDRITVLRNESRLGLAANWNRAIELSETDSFLIAHQDDLYEPHYLETMLRLLASRSRALAAHCKAVTIDENGGVTADPAGLYKDRFWTNDDPQERESEDELRVLQRGNYVIAPSVLFRRAAVARLGPFDEAYSFVTDWEYWIRASVAGYTLAGTHERLVRFRRHSRTATRAHELTMRRYEEELDLLTDLSERNPSSHAFRAIENTLLNDFVERLSNGDAEGARSLARFASERVPHFAGSTRERVMRGALRGGAAAGRALSLARRAWVGTGARRRRERSR